MRFVCPQGGKFVLRFRIEQEGRCVQSPEHTWTNIQQLFQKNSLSLQLFMSVGEADQPRSCSGRR